VGSGDFFSLNHIVETRKKKNFKITFVIVCSSDHVGLTEKKITRSGGEWPGSVVHY
jgi:hypothetical protein